MQLKVLQLTMFIMWFLHLIMKELCSVLEFKSVDRKGCSKSTKSHPKMTTTMDKLGKEVYADTGLVYKFRGKVQVPPLEMVDDVISVNVAPQQ